MLRRTNSVRLFSLFGIRVSADLSWFIALFLLIYLLSSPFKDTLHSSAMVAYLTTVASVLLLFVSLILHEFGHALAARRQGIGVDEIDLYLFGGLTRMSKNFGLYSNSAGMRLSMKPNFSHSSIDTQRNGYGRRG